VNRLEKYLFWTTFLPVAVTGIVYFWMKHFMESPDPFSVVNHPWQPLVLKAHILSVPLWVLTIGAVAYQHALSRIRSGERRGIWTGAATATLIVPMILTGYLIQSVTHQGWLGIVTWSHVVLSAAYILGLAVHGRVVVFRRRQGDTGIADLEARGRIAGGTVPPFDDQDAA
jgi:uncharacterized membrane protein YidH (DUF202 family)